MVNVYLKLVLIRYRSKLYTQVPTLCRFFFTKYSTFAHTRRCDITTSKSVRTWVWSRHQRSRQRGRRRSHTSSQRRYRSQHRSSTAPHPWTKLLRHHSIRTRSVPLQLNFWHLRHCSVYLRGLYLTWSMYFVSCAENLSLDTFNKPNHKDMCTSKYSAIDISDPADFYVIQVEWL